MTTLSAQGKLLLLGFASALLGIAGTVFLYEKEPGLNFALFFPLIAILGLLLARVFSRHVSHSHLAVICAGLFFSTMIYVRGSELLTFFNMLASALLLLLGAFLFTGKDVRTLYFFDYLKIPFLPLRFIPAFFDTFPAIVSLQKVAGGSTRTKEIVRGCIMASIALLVFAGLLSSADAGFEKLLAQIFAFDIDQELINRIIFGFIVTAFFVGGFGHMFHKVHPSTPPLAPAKMRSLGALETMILLSAINLLFLTFIIVQISALFGGVDHLLTEGLTYAEYAREGFMQLLVVAVLSLLIIAFTERQIVQREGVHVRSFQFASGALVLQVIIILASAFVRLALYEDAYGFTTIRLYSHAFMIWVGVVLALLSVHIWRSGKPADFAFRVFVTAVAFLMGMNTLNPDAFIAKQNLERYASTGIVDAHYLGTLSHDALPHTIHLLDDPKKEIRKNYAEGLYSTKYYRNTEIGGSESAPWQSSRTGDRGAGELLVPYRGMLEEYKL